MDALQSQSLQVELRERMEQFNQYWISSQQQVSFVEYKNTTPVFMHALHPFYIPLFN
jgi:hypothetical protein